MGKSAEVFATTVDVEAEAGVEVEVEGFRLRLEAGEVDMVCSSGSGG